MSLQESDAIKIYTDPRKGYWGKSRMMKKYRIMLNKVYALQRHKEVTSKHLKKLYKREGAIRPFFSVQVDLADFPKLQNPYNNNVRYLMVAIDVFSRFLWVMPLTSKEKLHIPLEQLFLYMKKEFGKTPRNMTGDNEFDTRELKNLATKYKFRWWFGDPSEKYRTGIVERVIRTIRNLIKRYLTQNDTTRYIDVLKDFVHNYNDTEHTHTRTRPRVAIKTGQTFPKPMRKEIPILRAGDKVRILQKRQKVFDKGDKPYYSKKVYEIIKKDGNKYVVSDLETGQTLTKKYYIHQLQKIDGVIKDKHNAVKYDAVGYDKGIEHKTIQRKNKRSLNGIDPKNIINKKEREEAERGLRYNDKEVFHDKPLPSGDKQLEKKQKQLESKVDAKRVQQLKNQIEMYKRRPRANNQRIINRIQKELDELRKPAPKLRRSGRVSKPPERYNPAPPKRKKARETPQPKKQAVPTEKERITQEIKDLEASASRNKRRRMYVVRVRRKITKLREQLKKLEPIKKKRVKQKSIAPLRRGQRKRRKPKRYGYN